MYLQIVDGAEKILSLGSKEITLIGVFLLIIFGLTYALVYFVKKYHGSLEERVNAEKDHSKKILEMNDENRDGYQKIMLILEIIKSKLFNNGN